MYILTAMDLSTKLNSLSLSSDPAMSNDQAKRNEDLARYDPSHPERQDKISHLGPRWGGAGGIQGAACNARQGAGGARLAGKDAPAVLGLRVVDKPPPAALVLQSKVSVLLWPI
jgi:hypothetical protein